MRHSSKATPRPFGECFWKASSWISSAGTQTAHDSCCNTMLRSITTTLVTEPLWSSRVKTGTLHVYVYFLIMVPMCSWSPITE
jgi:hypothetical protein